MPINVTIDADELRILLAMREEHDALQSERDGLRSALRLVTAERDLAEERLRAYRRELFGAKSEARASDQPGLFNEAEVLGTNATPAQEDTPETRIAAHTRKKRGHRKPLDPNLPREVVRHELPEAERFCNYDGHALVEIGVETSEQLDVIPEQLRVIQHQRVKYACPCCDLGIKVTPAPLRIIPRGLLTESALAWVASGKYQFGMPIYRQAVLLRRFGGDISSNTLAASMVRVGLATQPVINLMRDALLDADVIYCDETTFQVLKEEGRKPQTKSYLWAQMTGSGTPIRCFAYTAGRGAKLADKLFTGIRKGAVLMTDGYEPYNGIAEQYQLVHLGCWAQYPEYRFMSSNGRPRLMGAFEGPNNSAYYLCGHHRCAASGRRTCRSHYERNQVSRATSRSTNGSQCVCTVVRCTPLAGARLLAMAPMSARLHQGCVLPGGTVLRDTELSASYRTFSLQGCRVCLAQSTLSPRACRVCAAWRPLPMRCDRTT